MKIKSFVGLSIVTFCLFISSCLVTPSYAYSTCVPRSGGSYSSCIISGDFTNADLSGATFQDVEFLNVNLNGANFSNATFRRTTGIIAERANFSGAKFIESVIGPNDASSFDCVNGISLKGSTFENAIFYKAIFNCVSFDEAALSSFSLMAAVECYSMINHPLPVATIYVRKGNALNGKKWACKSGGSFWGFSKNNLYKSSDFATGLDFHQWDLSGVDLSGSRFIGVNLSNANFEASNLTNADFEGSSLDGALFEGSTLQGVRLDNIAAFPLGFCFSGMPSSIPEGAKMIGNCLINKSGGSTILNANLEAADLTQASLAGCIRCNLKRANLNGINIGSLEGSNLMGAEISKADLTNVDLIFANLEGLNLSNRTFAGRLDCANLAKTNLKSANLSGSTLTCAVLTYSNVSGAIFPSSNAMLMIKSGKLVGTPKLLPKNWRVIGGWLVGPGADLGGANLSNQNLTAISLSGANLQAANLAGAKLNPKITSFKVLGKPKALPTGWVFSGGKILKKK